MRDVQPASGRAMDASRGLLRGLLRLLRLLLLLRMPLLLRLLLLHDGQWTREARSTSCAGNGRGRDGISGCSVAETERRSLGAAFFGCARCKLGV